MSFDLTGIRVTDYESQTFTDEASPINIDAGDGCDFAFITCEVAGVRFRIDGEDPAADEGHLLEKEHFLILGDEASIKGFRGIREGETDATLRISYGL